MGGDTLSLIVFFALIVLTGSGLVALSFLFGLREPTPEKNTAYECGLDPVGGARRRFPIKYFLVALLFVIFSVDVVLLFPWAVVFKNSYAGDAGLGLLIEFVVFVGLMLVAFIYAWGRGALEWEK